MRLAVFGSSGLLGSSLVPHLRAHGHEVLTGRDGANGTRADLANFTEAAFLLDQIVPDRIVNLAGLTSVEECERNPQRAYMANVRIVENLARWVGDHRGSTRLVQLSTDHVYDGAGPHKEDDPAPTNYYGFSKYAGDLVAGSVGATVLRTNFFGPSRCDGRRSLSDWLMASLVQRRPITVFDDVRFSPLALDTLVELVGVAIEHGPPGVFNLGSRDGMTKADFAFAFAGALGLDTDQMRRGSSEAGELAVYRPRDMAMDSSRFERTFGVTLPRLSHEILSMKQAYAHEAR